MDTRTKKRSYLRHMPVAYAFVVPYMSLFVLFTVIPVVIAIVLSFTYFNMLEFPSFVFLDNFTRLFTEDTVFTTALQNTLIIAAVVGPGGYLLSLTVAWFLNELGPRLRAVLTFLFYAPAISGNAVFVWTILFSGNAQGYVNAWLIRLGITTSPILWFSDPKYMMTLLIAITLWGSLGTSFLSFIAGFQGIDKSLYEAGAMDGISNRWQELWYITLPAMRPQLMFGALMSITGAFSVSSAGLFGLPSKDYAVHTIADHLSDYGGARWEMGYACAIAVVLFFMTVLTNMAVKKLLAKVGG